MYSTANLRPASLRLHDTDEDRGSESTKWHDRDPRPQPRQTAYDLELRFVLSVSSPSKAAFSTDGIGHAHQRRLDRGSFAVVDVCREVAFDVVQVDR